ncbi:hypothetical protein [Streptomyces sp. NBC_01613]
MTTSHSPRLESTGLSAAECRTTIRSALEWILANATPREAA